MSDFKVIQEDDPNHKGLWLFGRDMTKVPCCRDSILNGCAGAAAGSIIGFIYRNSFLTALKAAQVSLILATFGTWFPCRYSEFKKRQMFKNIQEASKDKVETSDEYNVPFFLANKKDKPDG